MNLIDSSTLNNQDISTDLLVHTYTASGIHKIAIRLFVDQIAGNDDYVAYCTIQRGGAGSAYQAVPISTATVDSGITAIMFPTIFLGVSDGDVIKVYVLGAAGDTTTPDIITEIWEDDTVLNSVWTGTKAGYLDVAISSLPTTAQINTEVDTALSDYDAPTKAELDSGLAGLNDPSTSEINTALTNAHGSGSWGGGAGSGAIAYTYTVTDSVGGDPLEEVRVDVYTDSALTNLVANGTTDNFGEVVFYLDAGTYYFVSRKAGYSFTNPDSEVVS